MRAQQQLHKNLLPEVRALIPPLESAKYKGQAGKIAVIGGCREYTGAPFFSAYSALKVGVDIAHVFCTSGAATVIKSYSPELIVHPYLSEIASDIPQPDANPANYADKQAASVTAITTWLDRFDALVVGPGLGRDPLVLHTVHEILQIARHRNIPLIIDADGLWIVNQHLDLIQGYSQAILTPNAVEFKRLCDALHVDLESVNACHDVALKLQGPVVLRKGKEDFISDGMHTLICKEPGSMRRAGGQGDVLSGAIAAFVAWAAGRKKTQSSSALAGGVNVAESSSMQAVRGREGEGEEDDDEDEEGQERRIVNLSPLMLAAYGGCLTTKIASRRAFQRHGRAMGANDVIAELGGTIDQDLMVSYELSDLDDWERGQSL